MKEATAPGWDIVGHRRAVTLFRESLASGRVSHAYLICGPREIGKTTLALTFARAVNCDRDPAPCGECRTCRRIAKGVHPDVRVLQLGDVSADARTESRSGAQASGKSRRPRVTKIAIEQVRAVLHDVVLAPYEARRKCYIFRYAEDLSLEGIQVLLKTLEEPPAHVTLTLTTADAKILPQTVVSRCQIIQLAPVPMADVEEALVTRFGLGRDQAANLAHLSAGRAGWAINAATNPAVVSERAERVALLVDGIAGGRLERLALAERLATEFGREPEVATQALELWLEWWRDVLLTKSGVVQRVVNRDRLCELEKQADRTQLGQLAAAMQATKQTLLQLQQNVNPRLALEVLMLSLPAGPR